MQLQFILLILIPLTHGGFGPPPNKDQLLRALYGNPCDCKGGTVRVTPTSYTQTVDCQNKIAYLTYSSQMGGGMRQEWNCVSKPQVISSTNGKPGPCPSSCSILTQMNQRCYSSAQLCTHSNGKVYLTAILQTTFAGTAGGDWDHSPSGGSKYSQASCRGTPGHDVCWPPQAPIHISDGGGPSD